MRRFGWSMAIIAGLTGTASFAAPRNEAFDAMIQRFAKMHGVPETLIHRIILRESRYNPGLTNHHRYFGLMQISYATARSMGYSGPPAGLLDPAVNLTYGVPYLANAYHAAGENEARAVALYAGGYYYVAKRRHMLGSLRTAGTAPIEGNTPPVAPPLPQPPANPLSRLVHFLTAGNTPAATPATASEPAAVAAPAETPPAR